MTGVLVIAIACQTGGSYAAQGTAGSVGRVHGDAQADRGATAGTNGRSLAATHRAASPVLPLHSRAAVTSLRSTISNRRTATWRHQDYLGYDRTRSAFRERTSSATEYLRWIRSLWAHRAHRYWRLTLVTLRDYRFCEGCHAWHKAVQEVQRVFPGTASWLLSCSGAEGGHGRWVGYSGVPYSTWLRDSDTVGGPLQFRFSTFTGMYRHGLEYLRDRGYRAPRMDTTTAWRSALGQAIAGGWARYTGNDDSHWSASWSNGCR